MILTAITLLLLQLGNVAAAIVDTIVTPTPGLGYGRIADVAALAMWTLSALHIVNV
jgi:hypothetical protein